MTHWEEVARRERKRKAWRVVCWLTVAAAFVVIGSQHEVGIDRHLDDFGQGWRLLAWALSMGSAMWLAVDYQHNHYRDDDGRCTYCGEKWDSFDG